MKKILTIAVASLAIAAVADSYSPQIGVTTLSLTKKNNILPVQFTSLARADNVTADELVCTNNIPNGSYLYVFTDNSYKAWYLQAGTGWVAPDIETTGKVDGELGNKIPSAAAVKLNTGSAIWLSFPTSQSSSVLVSVYGKCTESLSSSISSGTAEAPVSNLICNPKAEDTISLADKLTSITKSAGDTIKLIGDDARYVWSVWSSNEGKWYKIDSKGYAVADLPTLSKYQGFWYVSKGGSGTIQW